ARFDNAQQASDQCGFPSTVRTQKSYSGLGDGKINGIQCYELPVLLGEVPGFDHRIGDPGFRIRSCGITHMCYMPRFRCCPFSPHSGAQWECSTGNVAGSFLLTRTSVTLFWFRSYLDLHLRSTCFVSGMEPA